MVRLVIYNGEFVNLIKLISDQYNALKIHTKHCRNFILTIF